MRTDVFRSGFDYLPSAEDIANAIGYRSRHPLADTMAPIGMFAAGIVVGAAIALLFAPRPGDELRREIGSRMNQLRERTRQRVEEASGQAA